MPMHMDFLCISHSYLNLLGLHHFIIYILRSLTLNIRWTYEPIHTIHEASFIIYLGDLYLLKIIWYKTYASCKYAKVSISIPVGSID